MKKIIITLAIISSLISISKAQTNSTPSTVIGYLEQYLTHNDTNYNGWQSNHFDVWEAAVFQTVAGTPGASAVGNTLGVEFPIYHFSSNNYSVHLESITDFEQVFGDIGWQGVGIGLDYNFHQLQLSAGLDANIGLKGPLTMQAAPYIEFKYASTSLAGASPFVRYEVPIRKNTGSGMFMVGIQFPF